MPLSAGLMRPSGETAVASTITRPAPPTAREPRWTRCQSLGKPLSDEYWHMGETAMRFLRTTSLRRNSLNKAATLLLLFHLETHLSWPGHLSSERSPFTPG